MRMHRAVALLVVFGIMITGCSGKSDREKQKEQTVPDIEITVGENAFQSEQDETPDESEQKPEKREELIVIDPGHSAVVSGKKEPVGPGSSEQKAADTSGTSGVATGIPEYELNLNVALKLRTELENRGYTVVLTRETSDIQITNIERAEIANNAGADAFVRIHANGSESSSAKGAMTICITPDNPFYPELYTRSRKLSDCIINEMCASAGCENDGVWETDTMSGCNWSRVPVTIVEMGYMTNPEEDRRLADDEYQNALASGMADGLDSYFGY